MRGHQHDNDCDTHIIQDSGLNQEADYQTYYVGCVYTGEGTSISCRQEKLGSPRQIDTRLQLDKILVDRAQASPFHQLW